MTTSFLRLGCFQRKSDKSAHSAKKVVPSEICCNLWNCWKQWRKWARYNQHFTCNHTCVRIWWIWYQLARYIASLQAISAGHSNGVHEDKSDCETCTPQYIFHAWFGLSFGKSLSYITGLNQSKVEDVSYS